VRSSPPLTREQWSLLGLLGLTLLINHYDFALLTLALPQIQAGLAIPEDRIGSLVASVRLGVLPALGLAFLADRAGRRRLLVTTILGFTLCTAATAFARDAAEFAACQFLARMFIAAEEMLAIVVLTEELGADARGFGLGILAAFGALGSELFPTSYRSTASGLRAAVGTAAGSAGLWLEAWIFPLAGSHAEAITWLPGLAWIAPLVVALLLPETARRELEEISPAP